MAPARREALALLALASALLLLAAPRPTSAQDGLVQLFALPERAPTPVPGAPCVGAPFWLPHVDTWTVSCPWINATGPNPHGTTCNSGCNPVHDYYGNNTMTCRDGIWTYSTNTPWLGKYVYGCNPTPCLGNPPVNNANKGWRLLNGKFNCGPKTESSHYAFPGARWTQQVACFAECDAGYVGVTRWRTNANGTSNMPYSICKKGTWKGIQGSCIAAALACIGDPPAVANAKWQCDPTYGKGGYCGAKCNPGYTGNVAAQCLGGRWGPVVGSCALPAPKQAPQAEAEAPAQVDGLAGGSEAQVEQLDVQLPITLVEGQDFELA